MTVSPLLLHNLYHGIPRWCNGKNPPAVPRRCKRCGFDPWVGREAWRRGNGTLQDSCLENLSWTEEPGGAEVHGVKESDKTASLVWRAMVVEGQITHYKTFCYFEVPLSWFSAHVVPVSIQLFSSVVTKLWWFLLSFQCFCGRMEQEASISFLLFSFKTEI